MLPIQKVSALHWIDNSILEMKVIRCSLLVALLSLMLVEAVKKCEKIDSCRCSTDTGEINLWSLAGQTPKRARFNISSPSLEKYYLWSPCTEWATQGHPCENAAVCEVTRKTASLISYSNMGKRGSSNCALDERNGRCLLTYDVAGSKRKTAIALECDEGEEGKVDPMISDFSSFLTYTTLHSMCACPGKCALSTNGNNGILYRVFSDDEGKEVGAIVGIVIAGIILVILLVFAIFICCLRRKLPSGLPKPSICTTVKVGLGIIKKKLCPCC